jgi:hypothetical protein
VGGRAMSKQLGDIFFKFIPLYGIDEGEYIRPTCIIDVRQNNDNKGCRIYLDYTEFNGNNYINDRRNKSEVIRELQKVMYNYEKAMFRGML